MSFERLAGARLRGLDGLRGLAVIMVVFYHYTFGFAHVVHPHAPGLIASFFSGHYGVELFFMISGYVILMTVERSPNLYAFAVGRFSRLYPPFVFAMLLTAVLTFGTGFPVNGVGLPDLPGNFAMVTSLLGLQSVDSAYWTLSFEFMFYVIIGVGLLALRIRKVEILCIAWLAVAYVCKFGLHAQLPNGHDAAPFSLAIVTVSDYANLFVLGMMFHRLHTGQRNSLTWPVIVLALLPIVLLMVVPLASGDTAELRPNIQHAAFVIVFAVLVYLAPIRRVPLLQWGLLPWLGGISYSLYLIHQFAGYRVIDALEVRGVDPNVAIVLTASLAVIVAYVMREIIERPGQRLVRRVLEHPRLPWGNHPVPKRAGP